MSDDGEPGWEDDSAPDISVEAAGPDAAAPADPQRPSHLLAERFGKYLIVGELALGGMAELFLGVHRGLEGFVKVVVIKRVLPHFSDNAAFVRMFVEEARLAARLEHANIVRTHEFGEVDGRYYTVMEYLPGEDLAKVLDRLAAARQQLAYAAAATIIAQVCAGLHFAHQLTDSAGAPLGLVHRDVNPANIVLTYAGEVKLIDFGIAKTAMHTKTAAGTLKGKLAYMSPEHLLARDVDRRSDVFAAGIVLWELLTGSPLFVRANEAATIHAIMNDPVPPVRRTRPDVPAALEAIVARALARAPAERYPTAEAMQLELEAFLDGQPRCDARALGRILEELFGPTRAEATRSIAQTRALATSISLVMKLRSEARADLAETVDALALGTDRQVPPALAPERPTTSRWLLAGLAVVLLAAIAGALALVLAAPHGPRAAPTPAVTAARASVRIESTPPGAAISIDGEPTGLTTPATVTGLTASTITVALELAGFAPRLATIDVPTTGAITEHFAFTEPAPARAPETP